MTRKTKVESRRVPAKKKDKTFLPKTSRTGEFQPRKDRGASLAPVEPGFRMMRALAGEVRAFSPARAAAPPGARVAAAIPAGSARQEMTRPGDHPWSAHVRLLFTLPSGEPSVGTGWVIGPRTIITAAHCVYDGGWIQPIHVKPGGDNSGFNTVPAVHSDVTRAWLEERGNERQKSDIGVIYVGDPFEAPITPLNYAVYSDAQLRRISPGRLSVAGFPANPFGSFLVDRGDLTAFNPPFLHYNAETSDGQSGAPVIHWEDDDTPVVIGVHHFNVAPNVNRAVRIGPGAASLLQSWTH